MLAQNAHHLQLLIYYLPLLFCLPSLWGNPVVWLAVLQPISQDQQVKK